MTSQEGSKELKPEDELSVIMDQYKETVSNRRHYSNLRFALFPVYFAIQYGLVQLAFKVESNSLPIAIYAVAGILSTYVFWTIEERILQYYEHLTVVGEELEQKISGRLISNWPKSTFKSDTRRSIQFVYLVFFLFWLFFVVKGVVLYLIKVF
jgi:hypothetical protein